MVTTRITWSLLVFLLEILYLENPGYPYYAYVLTSVHGTGFKFLWYNIYMHNYQYAKILFVHEINFRTPVKLSI